jgi:signal transduction histidine kinase
LKIKAINENGTESDPIELNLIFLPKWYQTWWFKSLMALLLMAIIYTLYRVRIRQLKKEEKIRRQLASDLHDDLGSTLNSVKVYANLALMEKQNTTHLQKIKESTQEAISGVRDMIWILDDKKDSPADLLGRIKQFAEPLCLVNHISFTAVTDPSASGYQLGKEEKRYLYMILKESVNNSIKYADCSHITVQVSIPHNKLSALIMDDGKGFDLQNVKEGNGLRNIRDRAREIHYEVTIDTSPGQGTRIFLQKI